MAYPRLPLQQRMEIIDAFVQAGMSPFEIAHMHSLPEGQVVLILREQGIPVERRKGATVIDKFSAAQLEDIVEEYRGHDMLVREICTKWGLSYNQLWKLLTQMQVPFRVHDPHRMQARAARMNRAVEMYVDGAKLLDIWDETGIDNARLYKELYKRKMPTRTQSKFPRIR